MGLLSGIGKFVSNATKFIGDIFGGSSSSSSSRDKSSYSTSSKRNSYNTIYEPDKVKVAEIESNTKITLAQIEQERIQLAKQARLDILECEAELKIALEETRAKGLSVMAQTIVSMQERFNEIAKQRLCIIENASLSIIKEIENFYKELENELKRENDEYNTEKLPKLLSILENYEEGSIQHNLYAKKIENDIDSHCKYFMKQIDKISQRQEQIIYSFLKSKDKVLEQTDNITTNMLEFIQQKQTMELNYVENQENYLELEDEKQYLTNNNKLLECGKS